jgi:membrane-associated phospholipid phosphatase
MKTTEQFNSSLIDPIVITKRQWIIFNLLFLILGSVAVLLWIQTEMDKFFLFSLNNAHFNDSLVILNQFFTGYGMAVLVGIYICYLILTFKKNGKTSERPIFLLIIFSFALAGISGDLLKEIFNRSRPIQDYANELRFFTKSETPAFPSGHATKSMALLLPFLFYARYQGSLHLLVKIILVITVFMVCISRIVLGAHYLSDVLAGIGWAFFCLPLSVLLSNKILKRMTPEKLVFAAKIWIFIYFGLFLYLTRV